MVVSRAIILIALVALPIALRWPLMQTWISQHLIIIGIMVFSVFIAVYIIFEKPRAWLTSPVGDKHISIAELHAAIVSILFEAMWVSAGNLFSMLWQLEEKVFDEARKKSEKPRFLFEGGWVNIDPGGRPIDTSTAAQR